MKRYILPLKQWIPFHTGADPAFSIEHRLFNVVGYFAGLIGITSVLINIIVGSSLELTLLSGFVTVVSWSVFYISRFKKWFKLGKWILTIFLFIVFAYIFFINNGSLGPMLHLYLVFFLLLLFIWNGRARNFFIVLFILNVAAFFLLELKFPHLIEPYESTRIRVLDVYLTYLMGIAMGGVILLFAKNSFVKEKVKAEKSDRLKSAFLANMSHEIRTPMNAILGFAQLLERDLPKSKKDTYLQVIQENSHSLLRLIDDIIDVSKIEAGEVEIKEGDVDVNDLIAKVASTYRQMIKNYPDKQVKIVESYPRERLFVIADKTRLNQVLVNLVSNAFKYTNSGSIEIGYSKQGQWLNFYVKDTGLGIRSEHIVEIFDRFRKIETEESYKIQPGTGIGLSISKNMVRLMGGEIGVSSEVGKGSTFNFTIPYKPSNIKVSIKVNKDRVVALNEIDLTGILILVVEDERTNYEFLRKVFERSGADILHAQDGKVAVEIFRENSGIDLILMDIMMPVMDGYEASRAIKDIDPLIPIIAQTALAMEGDEQKVLDSGCDDYISKPIRINELIEKIAKYVFIEKNIAS